METSQDLLRSENSPSAIDRPDFLKIICILSFVGTGLMLLIYGLGTFALAINSEAAEEIWPQMIKYNPQFENIEPLEFFHQAGLICVYNFFANVFTLIGLIMMWKLERMGFFIYAIAELATHFFTLNVDMGDGSSSFGGLIFSIMVDLVFIVMYFLNLKHMPKKHAVI